MNTSLKPNPAYSAPLGIDSRKVKDLLVVCDKQIIPTAQHALYKGLAPREASHHSDSEYESD